MMKKYLLLVCLIIVLGFAILSGGTKYAYWGCGIIVLTFSAILIKNIYTYNISRKQISDNYINLKRNNLANTISALLLILLNANNDVLSIKNTKELVLIVTLYMTVGMQLLISIFCIPKISTEGFICSSGKFIGFNQIKNIKSESGMFMSYKQLTVQYEESSEIFKVYSLDYENIKKCIYTYGNIVIKEIDKKEN